MDDRSDDEGLERLAALAEAFCEEVRGGRTSVEEYARRYPELAEEIREYFPSLEMLEVVGGRYTTAGGCAESISAQVTRLFGPETDPLVTLDDKEEACADFVSSVLGRIADRKGSHRYDLRGEVGRGGQGAVLVVWDEDLRRNLAMKVVLRGTDADGHETPVDSRTLGRFLEEAQVTGQLDHPGIVPVHELGLDEEGHAYFTMKLVKGRDLRTVLELAREEIEDWTLTRALNVMLKVCEALAYAHSKGVIHRDLKPSNVMVGKFGEVYVMDWGLARVLGVEDRKDIRIQPDVSEEIHSPRHEPSANGDGSLVTMDGDVVGTPAYMSPEQAHGDLEAMGAHSDVYSVGAMLYQLLTGRMPYVPEGARPTNREIWLRVQSGPPEPLFKLAPDVPAELVAICEKAMTRNVGERYRDTSELADDLRAFLENRVVSAYRTGALIELRKWIERNKPLAVSIAAGFLAVVAGLATSVMLKNRSDAYAKEASETAAREKQRAEEVLRLSASQDLAELKREADKLWPPEPGMKKRYEEWLRQARALVASLDPDPAGEDIGHRARLADLEARALPYTGEQRETDRSSHPRYEELETLRAEIAARERAQAVSEGRAQVEEVPLDEDALPSDQDTLSRMAWALVKDDRTEFGREAEGLALARLALELVEDDEGYCKGVQVLSTAHVANGNYEDALAELDLAASVLSDPHPELDSFRTQQALAIEANAPKAGDRIEDLETNRLAPLEAVVSRRTTWRFDDEADRWWHTQLVELVAAIEAFGDPETGLITGISPDQGWGIERRLAWAEKIEERTVTGERVARRWAKAIASISNPEECPQYGGLTIEPQLGLVPIERDPASGLWEFGHPLTGEVPKRDDGRLVLTEETGLVFVLVPGGTFTMGSQANDPTGPNYDPKAMAQESPPHRVSLSPFFLSKYEMAQGPWQRFVDSNPSYYPPPHAVADSPPFTLLHPVEQVDWFETRETLHRMGLALPTEAQWEYAARGGTSTAWWTGGERASLIGAANLADQAAARIGAPWGDIQDWPDLDDGFAVHAPVNHYSPNPFGFHNVHGNVWEWCEDGFIEEIYARAFVQDPVTDPSDARFRVCRGGSYDGTAWLSRAAGRDGNPPESAGFNVGVRPARAITGEIRYPAR